MHLLRVERRSLDDAADAVDLDHSPADICFLSFSDSDLGALAGAHDGRRRVSLRLASLDALKHPYSVDLYLEKSCARAQVVIVRLLGGLDYWRYGVEELAARARASGFHLAVIPGDAVEDPRLDAVSTLPAADLRRLDAYFQHGGPENLGACLDFVAATLGRGGTPAPPVAVAPVGLYRDASRAHGGERPKALILFYRSLYLAGDIAPILAMSRALFAHGLDVTAAYVTSLKDESVTAPLSRAIDDIGPDVILCATGFSARLGDMPSVLERADAPILQVVLAGSSEQQWSDSNRGLRAADLAMNVVLPEIDGRVMTRAISFKAEAERIDELEFTRIVHRPNDSRIDFVASLAAKWAALRRLPNKQKRLGLILSDYPQKNGRTGYAVGLDTYESAIGIARHLREMGYDIDFIPQASDLARFLSTGFPPQPQSQLAPAIVTLEDYETHLAHMPHAFANRIRAAWGDPASDPRVVNGAFHFRVAHWGRLVVAAQPDRGRSDQRKAEYHDGVLPPRHAYVAFYAWLRANVDALIHCGAHGSLEWLPGKAVALSDACAPEAVLGPTPLIYPFIVNNPGEAAQAKRRSAAVIVSHLTPTLVAAGSHGAAADLEALFDEYADAQILDPRRAKLLAEHILEKAQETGLLAECGAREDGDALRDLDAWICDLKDLRIADGLHVFGRSPDGALREAAVDSVAGAASDARETIADKIDRCGHDELASLARALEGRFVEPGPAGAPSRGRQDVLPTGRNIFGTDPRAAPTRTAWEIGLRTADAVLTRYAQDHGEWPRRIVLDLWGSATMRNGGDDLAQALAHLGARPVWDHASTRVNGFEIMPLATLGRPRVDVTLRISGLFRDMFPMQIALFDAAVRAVAMLDESSDDNPLVGAVDSSRVFGAAPGSYGAGLTLALASGDWSERDELGRIYLDASSFVYGVEGADKAAPDAFAARVADADAFVHVQDMPGQDVLDSDAFAQHEGGFAAAAALLGHAPALYHVDATQPDKTKVRTLGEEIARVLRGRAINPRWLAGMMRHGHRGAAEIAETVDNLHAYAALTDAVSSRQFDLLFDAICGDERVRDFLETSNPQAAVAIAEKFEDAARRGFWTSRRNSSIAILGAMRSRHG